MLKLQDENENMSLPIVYTEYGHTAKKYVCYAKQFVCKPSQVKPYFTIVFKKNEAIVIVFLLLI